MRQRRWVEGRSSTSYTEHSLLIYHVMLQGRRRRIRHRRSGGTLGTASREVQTRVEARSDGASLHASPHLANDASDKSTNETETDHVSGNLGAPTKGHKKNDT